MTDSTTDKERGEKRGILGTGRAQKLDKDASVDAGNDDSED